QEGLQLPGVKIVRAGEPCRTLLDVIAANVRLPEMTLGDIRAGIAALTVGERRILELAEKYGVETLLAAMDALLDHSAATVTHRFRTLPRGTFEADDWVDDDGLGNGPFQVRVKVTITDEELIVDYTGSSPQAPGPVNNTWCGL